MSKELTIVLKHEQNFYSSRKNRLTFKWHDYDKYEELNKAATAICDSTIYDFDGNTEITTDPYGDVLREISIGTFLRIYTIPNASGYDLAILAYLSSCPPADLLMLYYS
jgi:hypothetical protein